MGDILRRVCKISPIIYGRHFAYPMQNFSYSRGMLLGVGVHYFSTSTPLYVGDITCRGKQNFICSISRIVHTYTSTTVHLATSGIKHSRVVSIDLQVFQKIWNFQLE